MTNEKTTNLWKWIIAVVVVLALVALVLYLKQPTTAITVDGKSYTAQDINNRIDKIQNECESECLFNDACSSEERNKAIELYNKCIATID